MERREVRYQISLVPAVEDTTKPPGYHQSLSNLQTADIDKRSTTDCNQDTNMNCASAKSPLGLLKVLLTVSLPPLWCLGVYINRPDKQ